jgi:uncharacterized protein YegJ (DUF2314 family)
MRGLFSKLFGRKKKDDDFLSIVYLLQRPRRVDEPPLRAALLGLVQSVFKMDEPPVAEMKEVSENGAGLVIYGQPFVVYAVGEPYTPDDPERITPDLRKQNLLKEHKAWLACDWMLPVADNEERHIAYQTMGMVMATVAMAGLKDDIIAVFDKATGRLVPFEAHVPERLISDFPESVFDENPPILSSEGLEEALQKAAEEAQGRLPEFVTAFENRRKGEVYAIKARFEEGESVEWMWVQVEHITADGFEGRLDNNPGEITRLKAGDRVSVTLDEVADWVINGKSGMRGGFSVEVFNKHAESEQ